MGVEADSEILQRIEFNSDPTSLTFVQGVIELTWAYKLTEN